MTRSASKPVFFTVFIFQENVVHLPTPSGVGNLEVATPRGVAALALTLTYAFIYENSPAL